METAILFPTCVGVFSDIISEKERIDLIKKIKSKECISHPVFRGNGLSSHKIYNDFLSENIVSKIQNSIDEYVDTYGCTQQILKNYWFNIQNSNSVLTEHTHGDSIVSGALYLNVDDTCKIFFHNPNPYAFIIDKDPDRFTEYSYEYYWMNVKNSQLIIFPSWLKHGKNDVVNFMDDRIVISFNTVKRDGE
jgi:hypothetical protein